MKKLVFKFLDIRFRGVNLGYDVYDMSDVRTEHYYRKGGAPIIEIKNFHNERGFRYRVNKVLYRDLKGYFDLHDLVIDSYVHEWCRDKTRK